VSSLAAQPEKRVPFKITKIEKIIYWPSLWPEISEIMNLLSKWYISLNLTSSYTPDMKKTDWKHIKEVGGRGGVKTMERNGTQKYSPNNRNNPHILRCKMSVEIVLKISQKYLIDLPKSL
jgi:hypothetical protein